MRVALFAHGTRGDVAPMVALGWLLSRRGHEVTLAVADEFRPFAQRAGLATAPLPLDITTWLRTPEGQRLLRGGGVAFLRGWTRQYRRHAGAFDDAFMAAADGAEALIGNQVTCDRALALAEAMRVPMATYGAFPIAPSREYASLTLTTGRLRSPALRTASHELAARLYWRQIAAPVDSFRRKLGLPPSPRSTYHTLARGPDYPVLYALSPSIFPRPSDWPDHVEVTAAWKLPEPLREDLGETLPADLEEWLGAGERPLFFGFGSMPVLEPQALLDDIATVTGELGLRAIVSENCVAPGGAGSLPGHLRAVGAVDHDRLFPRCAAVVHHGGIGSIATSLGAGVPTMVCSVFADQPWWGEHMKRLGVGTHVRFRKLNRDRLRVGLRTTLEPATVARADALGAAIRAEGDGLAAAGQWLEDRFRATPLS